MVLQVFQSVRGVVGKVAKILSSNSKAAVRFLVPIRRDIIIFSLPKKRVSSDVTSSLGGLKEIRTRGDGVARGRPLRRNHCISNENRNKLISNSEFEQVSAVR